MYLNSEQFDRELNQLGPNEGLMLNNLAGIDYRFIMDHVGSDKRFLIEHWEQPLDIDGDERAALTPQRLERLQRYSVNICLSSGRSFDESEESYTKRLSDLGGNGNA